MVVDSTGVVVVDATRSYERILMEFFLVVAVVAIAAVGITRWRARTSH